MNRKTRAAALAAVALMASTFAVASVQGTGALAAGTAPNNTLYVVDRQDNAIGTVTIGGSGPVAKRNFAVLPGALSNGIVFDHFGNLVVSMRQPNGSGGLASVDSSTGALLRSDITIAPLGDSWLAMDPATDNVYAADTQWLGLNRVNVTTGALQSLNPDNLNQLSGITFTPDRRLFVVGSAGVVSELDPDTGHVLRSLTIGSTIEGLTFDPTRGTLFTSNGNCQQLCELAVGTPANPTLSLIRTYPDAFHGLAADGQGNIYYAVGSGLYRYGLNDGSNTLLVPGVAQWSGGFGSLDAIAPLVGAGSKPQNPTTVLTAGPRVSITPTEGNAFSGALGSFTDSNPNATTAGFTATIDWGDGSGAVTATVSGPTGGPFTVSGSHTYADEGHYALQVSARDAGGSTVNMAADATVGDAQLTATAAQQLYSTTGLSNQTLATFTDANPAAPAADFIASIDWGDGTTGNGTVSQLPSGAFAVNSSHAYGAVGPQNVVTTIKDRGGSTATATTPVLVYGVTSGGDFVISSQGYAHGTATFWSPSWGSLNPVTGGPAPAAFKGFETSAAGVVPPGSSWTGATGAQYAPPAQIPQYLAVIVTDSVNMSGPTLNGNVVHMAIVKVNPGYTNSLDSSGTGTVVALLA